METCRGPAAYSDGASFDPGKADSITLACTNAWQAEQDRQRQSWWGALAEQVPPGILLLFLLATLSSLYRYNLRLAGFHHSRADVLEIISEKMSFDEIKSLSDISVSFAADKVEFARANTPADQATEIAKAVLSQK